MKYALVAAAILLAFPSYALAGVRVMDGDTLSLNGEVMRLHGIDAPEAAQICKGRNGKNWPCGTAATRYLRGLVKQDSVRCDRLEHDAYGRTIAICHAGGVELNAAMVEAGLAWAFRKYSFKYNRLENRARKSGKGIWQAKNTPAWEFRSAKWNAATATNDTSGPGDCNIKGNINRKGQRIYHMPWQKYYGRTRINTGRGERWFCNENEARAAGWRRARN